jgi:hypothetical protein
MSQATTFAHHDMIAGLPYGSVVMVSEPIRVQRLPQGSMIQAVPGMWLRVKFLGGGLWCEAAIDGKVTTVVVNAPDFGSLDPKADMKEER